MRVQPLARCPARRAAAARRVAGRRRACGDDDNDSSSSDTTTSDASGADHQERGQRGHDDHGRLEELHRAEGARRDLRPGARSRRLQGQDRAQPRRREDRAEGARGRHDRRLPRVHGHGARLVLQRQVRPDSRRTRARPSTTPRRASPRRTSTRSTRRRSRARTRSRVTQKTADKLGVTNISDLEGKSKT